MEVRAGLPPALSSLPAGPFGTPCSRDQLSRGLGLPSCVTGCAERGGPGARLAALEEGGVVAGVCLLVTDSPLPAAFSRSGPNVSSGRFPRSDCQTPRSTSTFLCFYSYPHPRPPFPAGRWVESAWTG